MNSCSLSSLSHLTSRDPSRKEVCLSSHSSCSRACQGLSLPVGAFAVLLPGQALPTGAAVLTNVTVAEGVSQGRVRDRQADPLIVAFISSESPRNRADLMAIEMLPSAMA
jgi:hypothetical protein